MSSYLGQKPSRSTAAQPGNDPNRPLPLQGRGFFFLYPDPRPEEFSAFTILGLLSRYGHFNAYLYPCSIHRLAIITLSAIEGF